MQEMSEPRTRANGGVTEFRRRRIQALVQRMNVATEVELLMRDQPLPTRCHVMSVIVRWFDEADDWWESRSHFNISAWRDFALQQRSDDGGLDRLSTFAPGAAYE